MNVVEFLLNNEIEDASPALITSRKEFSFGQIRSGAEYVARLLIEAGMKKGDCVILFDQSSFFWSCVYLGTMMVGCVIVPLPVNMKSDKFIEILKATTTKCVLFGLGAPASLISTVPSGVRMFQESLDKSPAANIINQEDLCAENEGIVSFSIQKKTDLAALMFTSGSTGEPRGVKVTHENIIANTNSIIHSLLLTQRDRIMAVLPFYYCFGTSLLHTHLATGGSIVIENNFLFPEVVLNRIEQTKCTGLAGVPSTFQILLRRSTFRERQFLDLRYFQQAGGKLPDKYISELRSAFPEKELYVMYGQTEATARLSCLPPEKIDDKLGSIGKGIPGVALEVLGRNGKPVSKGEVGEIVASGNNITAGYWEAPGETEKYFKKGKLYTGDLATVDEEGYIYIVDREKDFIKCAGYRVSSKEIEEVALEWEGVIEAVAVGQEDENLGESICLFISHLSGMSARKELEGQCKRSYKWPFVPKRVIALNNIPKKSSGKPDKIELKAMLAVHVEGEDL